MLSAQEIQQLLEQARRNEKIQQRLDEVEEFILARHAFRDLLRHLPRRVATIYELDNVTLTLVADNQRLREAVEGPLQGELPAGCFLRRRQELRLLLADLERPFLSNRLAEEFIACFFSPGPFVASAAIIPLWVRGEMLGTLNLGSASPRRYQPDFETHFLRRLGRKVAAGMDSALLMEQARLLERREAAVEMAGAACHELAQPLTTANLLLEKLKRSLPPEAAAAGHLSALEEQLVRLGELVRRISQVSDYVTRPYAAGLKIIDVDAASAPPQTKAPAASQGG
jgi:uncharacterized protein YigA (DUF484 family)